MLAEAINAIQEMAKTATLAAKPTIVAEIKDPRKITMITADGKTVVLVKTPEAHKEKLATPTELARFIEKHIDSDGAIFVSFNKIEAVYDLAERIDAASTLLGTSDQFTVLEKFSDSPTQMTQKDFVRLLRIQFRKCLPSDQLIGAVKSIRFDAGQQGVSVIAHGANSISRAARSEVVGTDAIPEEVCLNIPIWDGLPFRGDVWCAVEIDPEQQRFALTPYAGEIERVRNNALEAMKAFIVDEIDSGDMPPVYIGQP